MNIAGHTTVWDVLVGSGGMPGRFMNYTYFKWFIEGNQSTDDYPDWEDILIQIAEWIFTLPEKLVGYDLFDLSFVDVLTRYYGSSPNSNGNGSLQCLHAMRMWKGGSQEALMMGKVESAYNSSTTWRMRIEDATAKALEAWKDRRSEAMHWIGHAAHMIEDSFAIGHTLRDVHTMELLDLCLSSSFSLGHVEEKGEESIRVCTHTGDHKDEIWNVTLAARADSAYLHLVSELITLVERGATWQPLVHGRLKHFFDVEPGLHDRSHLNRDAAIYVSTCDRLYVEGKWDLFAPFQVEERAFMVAYDTDTGDYTFVDIHPSDLGSLEFGSRIGGVRRAQPGYIKLIPLQSPDGSTWLFAYQPAQGIMALYRAVHLDGVLQLVQSDATWLSGASAINDLYPLWDDEYNCYILGYKRHEPQSTSACLFAVHLDFHDPCNFNLAPTSVQEPALAISFGNIPDEDAIGMRLLAPLALYDQDEPPGSRPSKYLLFYNADGDTRVYRVHFENSLEDLILSNPRRQQFWPGLYPFIPLELDRNLDGTLKTYTYSLYHTQHWAGSQMEGTWEIQRYSQASNDSTGEWVLARQGTLTNNSDFYLEQPFRFNNQVYMLHRSLDARKPLELLRLHYETPMVEITQVHQDPTGFDSRSNDCLNGEWVELVNLSNTSPVDMTGWTLRDRSRHVYHFGSFNLPPSGTVRVHTGDNSDTGTDLYCKRRWYIWNNTGDVAMLKDNDDSIISVYAYIATPEE
jgi:hypothetical protein